MSAVFGWLALLTAWMTLLWIGGAIGEWIMTRRGKE